MKRCLLVAGMLVALAGTALAQTQQVVNKGGWYLNPQSGQVTDANGNALVQDGYRPAWGTFVATNAINDTVTIGATPFAAESTISYPFSVAGYRWAAVYVDVKRASADTSVTWIALEPRAQLSVAQDSTSMGIWPVWGMQQPSATGAVQDTTTGDYLRSFGNSIIPGASSGQKVWTGEKAIAVWTTRGNGGEGEIQYFGFPRMKYIELKGPAGDWLSSLYLSWRVRILYGPAAASKVRIVLHVVMGS